ncbi:MAG: hypothetical protein AAF725_25560 [Acidobacteriota bacterium]
MNEVCIRYLGGLGEPVTVALRRPHRSVVFDLGSHRERLLEADDARDLCQQRAYFAELISRAAFRKRFGIDPPPGAENEGERILLTPATLARLRRTPRAIDDDELPEEFRRLLELESLGFRGLQAVSKVLGLKAIGSAEALQKAILDRWPDATEQQQARARRLIERASDA